MPCALPCCVLRQKFGYCISSNKHPNSNKCPPQLRFIDERININFDADSEIINIFINMHTNKCTCAQSVYQTMLHLITNHCFNKQCSSVWHFCGARNADKLEALNKRILRFILGDYSSPYNTLLSKVSSTSLCNKRIQNFLILLYKSLFFTHFPTYMKNMFSLRSSSYDLRGNYILSLSKPKTTTYGLNSFSYFSAKQWNALPDFFPTSLFADFKTKIQDVT